MNVYSQSFASALAPDCIQKGKDVHEGGARHCQFTGDMFNKVYADVVDSLIAIKELIYKEHKLTIDELLEVCAGNFEGMRGEYISNMLNSAPKFGNDLSEPEEMYRLLNDRVAAIGLVSKELSGVS